MTEYTELRETIEEQRKARIGEQGDPKTSARARFKVVDAKEPPLRVFFGDRATRDREGGLREAARVVGEMTAGSAGGAG
jgi:hypothetical protein